MRGQRALAGSRPHVLLFAVVLAHRGAFAADGGLTLEAGVVVDAISEAYGGGDLFLDPGQEVDFAVLETLRLTSDEAFVGGLVGLEWTGRGSRRHVRVDYEQNRESATADARADLRFGSDDAWRLDVDEEIRLQLSSGAGDDGRDVLQRLDLDLSRPVGSLGRLHVLAEHVISRTAGDTLSGLFDYTSYELGARLARETLGMDTAFRIDATRRLSGGSVTADDVRWRGVVELSRYRYGGASFDVYLEGSRRLYDDDALIAPSDAQLWLDSSASHALGGGFELTLDADARLARFDDPDATYFDYDAVETLLGGGWRTLSGMSFELAGGGEWLRPRSPSGSGYDQSRLRLVAGYLGGALWIDVEESLGWRRYVGVGSTGGRLDDLSSLSFTTSDFFYNELSVLAEWALGSISVEAYAQYTIERHDVDADDVSFALLNARITTTF